MSAKTTFRRLRDFAKETLEDFGDDNAVSLAAALAYYAGLSFGPLVLILVSVAGTLGGEAAEQAVAQIQGLLGPKAGEAVSLVVEGSREEGGKSGLAAVLGGIALLVSAAGVFAELQSSLNRIWDVRPKPGRGFGGWIRKRLLSLGMLLALIFLLVVSLAVSAVLSFLFSRAEGPLWEVVSNVVSLVAFAGVFALLFKYVPDVKIPWRTVREGAVITAVLFLVGKFAIGVYLGRGAVGSTYGAAGSLLVLLVWVYYCSLVLFLGAEITQTRARRAGVEVVPSRHAVLLEADGPAEERPAPGRRRRPARRSERRTR